MSELLIRCSSLGRIMSDPMSLADEGLPAHVAAIVAKKKRTEEEKAALSQYKSGLLSEGAKTYVRELAQQAIFSVDFEFSSKEIEKGREVEGESIALLNRVRGLSLAKNTERRDNGLITGECDLYDPDARKGYDLKSSWSAKTFPGWVADCEDRLYEWQCRGYMALWDAHEWSVAYALIDTPERLIGYEPLQMHLVSHIPEHMRLTEWTIKRDPEKEALIRIKVKAAQEYYRQVLDEFDQHHQAPELAA